MQILLSHEMTFMLLKLLSCKVCSNEYTNVSIIPINKNETIREKNISKYTCVKANPYFKSEKYIPRVLQLRQ